RGPGLPGPTAAGGGTPPTGPRPRVEGVSAKAQGVWHERHSFGAPIMSPLIPQEPTAAGPRNGVDQARVPAMPPPVARVPTAPGAPPLPDASLAGRGQAVVPRVRWHPRRATSPTPLEDFRTQVAQARALLTFGIAEGRGAPDGVPALPPEVIAAILQA